MSLGLHQAISRLVRQLEPGRLRSLAGAIRRMGSTADTGAISRLGIGGGAAAPLEALLREWRKNPDVEPSALALAMEAALHVHGRDEDGRSIEIVWTGPATDFVPVRRTERVLLELIGRAEESVFLVSFVAYGVPTVEETLREAMARGVEVSILVERGREYGGTLSSDPVDRLKESLPGARIYMWPPENRDVAREGRRGSVHAKCAVADGRIAFVTSANLTGAALERNMELGLLVTGGDVPRSIQMHLEALAVTGQIVRVRF